VLQLHLGKIFRELVTDTRRYLEATSPVRDCSRHLRYPMLCMYVLSWSY